MVVEEHTVKVFVYFLQSEEVSVVLLCLGLHTLVSAHKLSILGEEFFVWIDHAYLDWTLFMESVFGLLIREDTLENLSKIYIILWSPFHFK